MSVTLFAIALPHSGHHLRHNNTPARLKVYRDPLDEGCNLCNPKRKLLPLPHGLSSHGSLTCTGAVHSIGQFGNPVHLLGSPFLLHWPCSILLLLSPVLLSSCCHHDVGLFPDGPVPLESSRVPLLGTASASCAFGYLSDCLEILPAVVQGRGFQARECCS